MHISSILQTPKYLDNKSLWGLRRFPIRGYVREFKTDLRFLRLQADCIQWALMGLFD